MNNEPVKHALNRVDCYQHSCPKLTRTDEPFTKLQYVSTRDINATFQNGKSSIFKHGIDRGKERKLISAGTSNEHVNMTPY